MDRGHLEAEPESILTSEIKPNEIALPKSPGHYEEFIACVKSRGETLTPAAVALRSATPGWLGQIAMLTGRKLRWDPEKHADRRRYGSVEDAVANDASAVAAGIALRNDIQ